MNMPPIVEGIPFQLTTGQWVMYEFGIFPVRCAEPLTAEPKAKAEREAEQGVGLSRPGPINATSTSNERNEGS